MGETDFRTLNNDDELFLYIFNTKTKIPFRAKKGPDFSPFFCCGFAPARTL